MRTMLDLTVDAVAGCPLADKPDDPCDLSSPAVERHWSDTFHGRCKLDQRDIVGRSKKRMDPGRVAGCQRLLDQGLWQPRVARMRDDALDPASHATNGHVCLHSLHRRCVGCGHDPLRCDEDAMPFSGHVLQRRECGCKNGRASCREREYQYV